MAVLLELRRGTTAENKLFTGAEGEPTYDTDRKELRIHDGSTAGGKVVSVPTGAIMAFGGATAPEGWLACDGSAVSRTDYADLFAQIGSAYGDGDGSTTFNLPDLSDCFVQGGIPGTTHDAGLPNIKGRFSVDSPRTPTVDGAFKKDSDFGTEGWDGWSGFGRVYSFDASRSSGVYKDSVTTVQPKSVEVLYCIKY